MDARAGPRPTRWTGSAVVTSSQVTVDSPLSECSRTVSVTGCGATGIARAGTSSGTLTGSGTYPTIVMGAATCTPGSPRIFSYWASVMPPDCVARSAALVTQ